MLGAASARCLSACSKGIYTGAWGSGAELRLHVAAVLQLGLAGVAQAPQGQEINTRIACLRHRASETCTGAAWLECMARGKNTGAKNMSGSAHELRLFHGCRLQLGAWQCSRPGAKNKCLGQPAGFDLMWLVGLGASSLGSPRAKIICSSAWSTSTTCGCGL
jgi:hypothetical protein